MPDATMVRWRGGEKLRDARTCYSHLAGRLGVALADALRKQGHVILDQDGGEVTPSGLAFLRDFGVEFRPVPGRAFCRPCLDWSERRPHLAGRIGTAIAARCFDLGWVARQPEGRSLTVTELGRAGFAARLGLILPDEAPRITMPPSHRPREGGYRCAITDSARLTSNPPGGSTAR